MVAELIAANQPCVALTGAGISKLNHIFPYVTISLAATHPLLSRATGLRRVLMRSPTD